MNRKGVLKGVKNAGVRNDITLSNTISMFVHLVLSIRCKNVAF